MIESNFQSRMGIEIKRTDKKNLFQSEFSDLVHLLRGYVTYFIPFYWRGRNSWWWRLRFLELSTPSTLTNGGVQTIGGVGLLGPWSFPHFQHFSLALESVN